MGSGCSPTPSRGIRCAAGALKQLIRDVEPTSERWGLLGGRYKQLRNAATTEAERARYLDLAIDAYEQGMRFDLNDYYPTSNLPRLYRLRGGEGDEQKAVVAAMVTVAACERGVGWARTTSGPGSPARRRPTTPVTSRRRERCFPTSGRRAR